jgi:Mn2+/Fe2+ NRAMP family transporter
MAILFLSVAANVAPPAIAFAEGLVPRVPGGATFTVVALIGATISLASLFLSSAIAKGQSIQSLRTGIAASMATGGFISIVIMVAGSGIDRQDDDDDFGITDLINLFKDQVLFSASSLFLISPFF